ncbi:type IV secretion system DNA-binding domain-containing protein [Patescibacteria group bacterium]|nr:type IV secretion system DNA-binding domain-containing protein [Patescibacteria group bacterium]MBU1728044.1 type IV secretion system DNA-binding domain-containing protein [Patescibacteria group bacterium]
MELSELPKNKDITYLGLTSFRDKNQLFGIKRKDRRQHIYILGKSGTGKSVFMFNMVIQNILNGEGVCVVDPHGELVEGILSAIPPDRVKDVVYFNPADTDYHIGFNVLELIDPKYKHLVASGLMGIFTKIWANAWSARMEYILNNCILALLDTPGTTLLGIPRMLVDKDYRQKIISNLKDPVIKAFWVHEYEAWQDKFRNEAIAPIQNKVGQFLSSSIIRNVVGQSASTINIFDIMNEGKIFLVNVSKGRIGEDNSALLGGMLITKIQLASMERVRIPEDERKDFYLYVDEFQNFVTESFAGILSEARKYRLNLTVAHQYTAQLVSDKSSAVRDAVFGNVGTMVVFRVGADDADFLEKEFDPEFTPQDILSLPNFKVYLKLMIDGVTSRPFSAKTLAPLVKSGNKEVEEEVVRSSRALYCRPKEVVENEINSWSGMSIGDGNDGAGGEKFSAKCSVCGSETMVPFKPAPGRPIYCRDCIAKMKSGELKPLKGSAGQKYDESGFFKPLADLGIEFEQKNVSAQATKTEEGRYPERNISPTRRPSTRQSSSKRGVFSTIKKVFNKDSRQRPSRLPGGENLALKEVLNKTLSGSSTPVPEPISLDKLKAEKFTRPTEGPASVSPLKDRSASVEDMNKLKSFISEKKAPTQKGVGVQTDNVGIEEKKSAQPSGGEKPKGKIKEVPEDVLKKILE